jgi:hypothetical protein
MNNEKGTGQQGQNQAQPTDKGEDSDDRRQAAQQAWNDRAGIPRGTPEQGGKSADRVGGEGPSQAEPEIKDDDVEREGGSTLEDDEDIDEKKV